MCPQPFWKTAKLEEVISNKLQYTILYQGFQVIQNSDELHATKGHASLLNIAINQNQTKTKNQKSFKIKQTNQFIYVQVNQEIKSRKISFEN